MWSSIASEWLSLTVEKFIEMSLGVANFGV